MMTSRVCPALSCLSCLLACADGFGGGLHFEGNLLFNVVQDTGEHGATNSWE